MADRFELMVAPTGARLSKADHPALPISFDEIADTAEACAALGTSSIHVHVRDQDEQHALDPDLYAQALKAIRAKTQIDIQFSTEAAGLFEPAAQVDCLLHPDTTHASVALREFERAPDRLAEVYQSAHAAGKRLQHILYDPDDVVRLRQYIDAGTVPAARHQVIFVLGRYTENQQSNPSDLTPFLDAMGKEPWHWSLCAFGQQEQACLLDALQHGGHARIGFENNRLTPNGAVFDDNIASVESFLNEAARAGFQPSESLL
ncbi:MAG: 3-keto-5-aminohexanoate cleavage protein [Litoreibacter sp.]|nr:3-keto-5-aminohexanoate cleavage protein [Litoreibacter sp.]MCY4335167.1 3-keto-5-aminohexanoate cleavage protein [Litoreibacter sp.]